MPEDLKTRLAVLRQDPANQGQPLMQELERLVEAHLRLQRRLEKITRISDGFQRQLRELNDSLRRVSRTDALTDLPNRRAMVEELHTEVGRARREGLPLAVVMLDVDRFKDVNDTCGHEAGDKVLQALSLALRKALRAYDVCARWGGDEFLVLLPGTDRAGAQDVGGKLRKAVEALPVPSLVGQGLGLSVGIAVLGPDESVDALLRRADEAMYAAKHAGREGHLPT